jgi:hypothetical protein
MVYTPLCVKLNVGLGEKELKLPEVNTQPVLGLTLHEVPVKLELFEFIVTAAGEKVNGAQCVASASESVNCGVPDVKIVIELLACPQLLTTVWVTVYEPGSKKLITGFAEVKLPEVIDQLIPCTPGVMVQL